MKRVTIITPAQIGSNPRVIKEANSLSDAGFKVKVIAIRHSTSLELRDQSVSKQSKWELQRIDFTNALLRLQERAFQISAAVANRCLSTSWFPDIVHSSFSRKLAAAAIQAPAELYIAHYVAALPAAARAARRHGALYAYDAEDYHLGDLPDAAKHIPEKRFIRFIESQYLPGAAFVTAASPMIADAYSETYRIPLPTTLLNVFPLRNAAPAPTRAGTAAPGPSLYWFSQTIGPGRGLETVLDAIAQAQSRPHFYLRGSPANGYVESLRAHAGRLRVSERLHFLSPAPPDDLEQLGSIYDLGLVGELAETKNRQIALTNKLFSYILGGIPVVASDIPAHSVLTRELGAAMTLFPVGNGPALASALDSLLLCPQRLASARAHAWCLGQNRYNWDIESHKMVRLVQRAIG